MKITRKWLKLLKLENGFKDNYSDSDTYGEYIVTSRAKSFRMLDNIAIFSIAAIFFPIGGRFYPQHPFARWAFNEENSTFGKIARSLLVWPLTAVLGSIALSLSIAAIVGLAVVAAVTLPFTLLADVVRSTVDGIKAITAKKEPVVVDGNLDDSEFNYGSKIYDTKPESRPAAPSFKSAFATSFNSAPEESEKVSYRML